MTGTERRRWPREAHPVLVVEDDDALRSHLVDALKAAGHPVVAAANGAAALEEVHRRRPSVILLDLVMPVMNGPAFLAAYREFPEPRAPVVLCTDLHDPAAQLAHLGASDYLRKP